MAQPLDRRMEAAGMDLARLVAASGLDGKVVKAIVDGNFTPGPEQRRRIAAALGLPVDEIAWGHAVPVEHLRGNGPQCGRST